MQKVNSRSWSALVLFLFFFSSLSAQQGKDGARIISAPAIVVNEYAVLTADAVPGSTSVSVSTSSLNSGGLFSTPLSAGDLIMIIQMQGAAIKIAADSSYGEILNYNNCGNHEFCEVMSVPNPSTINLVCPLHFSYTAPGKVQVVRVPRYSSLTINNGAGATCPGWNGSSGGIIAIEISGNTVLNGSGKIDVSGKGFRGGLLTENMTTYGVNNFYWPTGDFGAEKGEGVSGFETEYDALGGRYCRGAAANGGGGGDAHNAGGGGGANGGNISPWTGKGCPDISNVAWAPGWNLEFSGFAGMLSSGGGRGGHTYSASDQDALLTGPNDPLWGGDQRGNYGGLGGRPLDYSSGKIFIGGGGGAGDQNDNTGGAGGNGGGLIYLMSYGTVSGSGQLITNGANGLSTSLLSGKDGAGGGGGGGTVILNSVDTIIGISVVANGGNGGDQSVSALSLESEGPGGGGGGGFVALSASAISVTVNGGLNGTTNSISLAEFPPNGATKGGNGAAIAAGVNFDFQVNNVTICSGDSTTLYAAGILPGLTCNWYDSPAGGTVIAAGNSFTTPVLTSSTTYFAGTCPGTYRKAVHVFVDVVQTNFTSSTVCLGTATPFAASATSSLSTIRSWSWNFGDTSGTAVIQNPVYTYSTALSFNAVLTVQDSLGCTKIFSDNVTVNPVPEIRFTSNDTIGCGSVTSVFTNNTLNGNSFTWHFGDGNGSSQPAPSHNYTLPGSYTVTLSSVSIDGCMATDSIIQMITVKPNPVSIFTTNNVCSGDTVYFSNASSGNGSAIAGYSWNFGDGTGTSSVQNATYFYNSPGTFPVQLIVTNAAGCSDTSGQSVFVGATPSVNFAPDVTAGCGQLDVSFTNNTVGSPSCLWHFGDGDTSTQSSPVHIYSLPGTYTVILRTSFGNCSDVDTVPNLISVHPLPLASYTATPACESDSVHFISTSNGNGSPISGYSWIFGDGDTLSSQSSQSHIYGTGGIFQSILTVTDSLGCSDSASVPVTVYSKPVVSFTTGNLSGCDSLTVYFSNGTTGASSFVWYFGDGDTSHLQNASHLYSQPGTYTIGLTATSIHGCTQSRAVLSMISVHESPVVDFSASDTNFCSGQCINFHDSSSGAITSRVWTFAGASPSSSVDLSPATICYSAPGIYSVTLTASNNFCSSGRVFTDYIHVLNCSQPNAGLISSDTSICKGSCLNFVNVSSNVTTLQWIFPGGTPAGSTDINPENICYADSGNYDVTLIASNPIASDTLFLPGFIHVLSPPLIPIIIQHADTLFVVTPAHGYQWYFNNILLSGANNNYFVPILTGNYSVEVIDVEGCTTMSAPYNFSFSGIFFDDHESVFYIYPNPLRDQLNVEIESGEKSFLKIKLQNVLGELIYEKETRPDNNRNLISIDVHAFSPGVYFISFETTHGTVSRKVVKE